MSEEQILREKVSEILDAHPEARDSDKDLILLMLERYGLVLNPMQKMFFMRCPSFEGITRARRQLQKDGLYEASPQIKAHRAKKQAEKRIEYSKQPTEIIERKIRYEGNVAFITEVVIKGQQGALI